LQGKVIHKRVGIAKDEKRNSFVPVKMEQRGTKQKKEQKIASNPRKKSVKKGDRRGKDI